MHELSIAHSLVEFATEFAQNAGAEKVVAITIRVGALSCIQKAPLCSGFEIFAESTLLQGAKLKFVDLPVRIFCASCESEAAVTDVRRLCCPTCGNPGSEIRDGQELEIESIEIIESIPTDVN